MIKGHEDLVAMIPWYANGTLAEEDRAAVEYHVGVCAGCRALLDEASLLMTEGLVTERVIAGFDAPGDIDPAAAGALADHPQAQILREYADGSQALGEETAASVRAHLSQCEACRTAVEAASAVGKEASDPEASPALDPGRPVVSPLHAPPRRPTAEPAAGLWAWLSGTLLQPAPAAAYLLLLLLAVPMVIMREPPATSTGPTPRTSVGTPGILPTAVTITGERVFRQRPDERPAPFEIELPQEPAAMIQLALKTRIDREDLDDPGATFEVEIGREEKIVWSTTTGGAGFSADRELRLLVPAALLRGGQATIVIRFVKPGDPLHGAEIFQRTIEAR